MSRRLRARFAARSIAVTETSAILTAVRLPRLTRQYQLLGRYLVSRKPSLRSTIPASLRVRFRLCPSLTGNTELNGTKWAAD